MSTLRRRALRAPVTVFLSNVNLRFLKCMLSLSLKLALKQISKLVIDFPFKPHAVMAICQECDSQII